MCHAGANTYRIQEAKKDTRSKIQYKIEDISSSPTCPGQVMYLSTSLAAARLLSAVFPSMYCTALCLQDRVR